MGNLRAYIVKEILKGSFLALLLLVTLVNLFTLSDELKDLGKGHYELKEIFSYLALTTPTVFYDLVPTGALIGSIFVLGAMANHREIVAMRSCGVSMFWIIRSVLLAGVFLVAIATAIGEFIAPDANRAAELLKSTAQDNRVMLKTKYGIWLREGQTFINIRQIGEQAQLIDLSFYHLDEHYHLKQVSHAEKAVFIHPGQWQLTQIQRSELTNNTVKASSFAKEIWHTSIAPDLLDIVVVNKDNLSSYDLYKYIRFLKNNQQKSQNFEAALWGRLLSPYTTFSMLLVSTPFVIGIQRGTSVGARLLIGIMIGLTFKILDEMTSNLGIVYNLNPIFTALLPSTLILIAAVYAINQLK